MTILTDIDDVLNNLCEEWCLLLNEKYGTSVTYDQVTEWDMQKFFPSLTGEQIFVPLHDASVWSRLKPKPGAAEYLQRLISDGHSVYLCTTTDYRNVRPKFECFVRKYFPFITWDQIIITSRKQLIRADVLVDDAVHNLTGGSYRKILFTAPHNLTFRTAGHGMIRADSWTDVYGIIRDIMAAEDSNEFPDRITK